VGLIGVRCVTYTEAYLSDKMESLHESMKSRATDGKSANATNRGRVKYIIEILSSP